MFDDSDALKPIPSYSPNFSLESSLILINSPSVSVGVQKDPVGENGLVVLEWEVTTLPILPWMFGGQTFKEVSKIDALMRSGRQKAQMLSGAAEGHPAKIEFYGQ